MSRKIEKKRNSILKKKHFELGSPTATASSTITNFSKSRRISFSNQKSIKEFFPAESGTVWLESYEECADSPDSKNKNKIPISSSNDNATASTDTTSHYMTLRNSKIICQKEEVRSKIKSKRNHGQNSNDNKSLLPSEHDKENIMITAGDLSQRQQHYEIADDTKLMVVMVEDEIQEIEMDITNSHVEANNSCSRIIHETLNNNNQQKQLQSVYVPENIDISLSSQSSAVLYENRMDAMCTQNIPRQIFKKPKGKTRGIEYSNKTILCTENIENDNTLPALKNNNTNIENDKMEFTTMAVGNPCKFTVTEFTPSQDLEYSHINSQKFPLVENSNKRAKILPNDILDIDSPIQCSQEVTSSKNIEYLQSDSQQVPLVKSANKRATILPNDDIDIDMSLQNCNEFVPLKNSGHSHVNASVKVPVVKFNSKRATILPNDNLDIDSSFQHLEEVIPSKNVDYLQNNPQQVPLIKVANKRATILPNDDIDIDTTCTSKKGSSLSDDNLDITSPIEFSEKSVEMKQTNKCSLNNNKHQKTIIYSPSGPNNIQEESFFQEKKLFSTPTCFSNKGKYRKTICMNDNIKEDNTENNFLQGNQSRKNITEDFDESSFGRALFCTPPIGNKQKSNKSSSRKSVCQSINSDKKFGIVNPLSNKHRGTIHLNENIKVEENDKTIKTISNFNNEFQNEEKMKNCTSINYNDRDIELVQTVHNVPTSLLQPKFVELEHENHKSIRQQQRQTVIHYQDNDKFDQVLVPQQTCNNSPLSVTESHSAEKDLHTPMNYLSNKSSTLNYYSQNENTFLSTIDNEKTDDLLRMSSEIPSSSNFTNKSITKCKKRRESDYTIQDVDIDESITANTQSFVLKPHEIENQDINEQNIQKPPITNNSNQIVDQKQYIQKLKNIAINDNCTKDFQSTIAVKDLKPYQKTVKSINYSTSSTQKIAHQQSFENNGTNCRNESLNSIFSNDNINNNKKLFERGNKYECPVDYKNLQMNVTLSAYDNVNRNKTIIPECEKMDVEQTLTALPLNEKVNHEKDHKTILFSKPLELDLTYGTTTFNKSLKATNNLCSDSVLSFSNSTTSFQCGNSKSNQVKDSSNIKISTRPLLNLTNEPVNSFQECDIDFFKEFDQKTPRSRKIEKLRSQSRCLNDTKVMNVIPENPPFVSDTLSNADIYSSNVGQKRNYDLVRQSAIYVEDYDSPTIMQPKKRERISSSSKKKSRLPVLTPKSNEKSLDNKQQKASISGIRRTIIFSTEGSEMDEMFTKEKLSKPTTKSRLPLLRRQSRCSSTVLGKTIVGDQQMELTSCVENKRNAENSEEKKTNKQYDYANDQQKSCRTIIFSQNDEDCKMDCTKITSNSTKTIEENKENSLSFTSTGLISIACSPKANSLWNDQQDTEKIVEISGLLPIINNDEESLSRNENEKKTEDKCNQKAIHLPLSSNVEVSCEKNVDNNDKMGNPNVKVTAKSSIQNDINNVEHKSNDNSTQQIVSKEEKDNIHHNSTCNTTKRSIFSESKNTEELLTLCGLPSIIRHEISSEKDDSSSFAYHERKANEATFEENQSNVPGTVNIPNQTMISEEPSVYWISDGNITDDIEKTHISLIDSIESNSNYKKETTQNEFQFKIPATPKTDQNSFINKTIQRQQQNNSTLLLCNKCKRCRNSLDRTDHHISVDDTTLTGFQLEPIPELKTTMDFMNSTFERFKGLPTLKDVLNHIEKKELLKNVKTFPKFEEEESVIGPEIPSFEFLFNNYKNEVLKEVKSQHEDMFFKPIFPVNQNVLYLMKNKFKSEKLNWRLDDTYFYDGSFEIYHKKIRTHKLIFNYSEDLIREFTPNMSIKFDTISFHKIIHYNHQTKFEILYINEILKDIPLILLNHCETSDKIFDFLDYLNGIIENAIELAKKLLRTITHYDGTIQANENKHLFVLKKTLYRKSDLTYCHRIFLIRIPYIETISYSDIIYPALCEFNESVKSLPKGIDFLEIFLNDPEKFLYL